MTQPASCAETVASSSKRRKPITEMVQIYFKEWVSDYVEGNRGGTHTMRRVIRDYLEENVFCIIDAMMGVKRGSFRDVELVSPRDGGEKTIAQILIDQHKDELLDEFKQHLPCFSLTSAEERKLRRVYREALLYSISEHLRALAEERAEAIAKEELRHLWLDEEHVSMVEESLRGEK